MHEHVHCIVIITEKSENNLDIKQKRSGSTNCVEYFTVIKGHN